MLDRPGFRIGAFRSFGSVRVLQAYIRVKLLTGLRRNDLLMLRTTEVIDEGIRALPHKTARTTGRSVIVEWNDQVILRAAIDEALVSTRTRPGEAGEGDRYDPSGVV